MPVRHRPAFTTVELLVVIALIAILAALLMAGVQALRGKEHLSTTQIEIREMVAALENFKTRYGTYPPSQITLGPTTGDVPATSQSVLYKIWPSLNIPNAFGAAGLNLTSAVTLEGDQCLVLFLGGRPNIGAATDIGVQGFSTSKSNPFAAGGERDQPFFKFKSNRLHKRDASNPFFSYCDGWYRTTYKGAEQYPCYAYFSPVGGGYGNHCGSLKDALSNAPVPLKDTAATPKYLNRDSFQLMSSGSNLLWGTLANWQPGMENATNDSDQQSMDNITNFANGLLAGN